jgi:hypothetical protein
VIDVGFCLDLTTSNGITAVRAAYAGLRRRFEGLGKPLPENWNPKSFTGEDRVLRELDCAVVNYLHEIRREMKLPPFDSVRGLFSVGGPAFSGSMFKEKTHTQICVRNQEKIHGVFRVHERYFSSI